MKKYAQDIKNEIIPTNIPLEHLNNFSASYECRKIVTSSGLWVKISTRYFKELAEHLKNKNVLEVMSGAGWFGKGLSEQGIDIHCTDDFSWEEGSHKKLNVVHPVEKLDAINAVKKYKAQFDILLISWPPYGDETILEICKEWGPDKCIIYVGENDGGCNAPEEFFDNFIYCHLVQTDNWFGLHDETLIGYYEEVK